MRRKPGQHLRRVGIRRKHRVEHVLDNAVADHQREALEQGHPIDGEGGRLERRGKAQVGVAQEGKRQVQARDELLLVGGVLGAQAEDGGAERTHLGVMITEPACFRRIPRAPGIASQSVGKGWPGWPLRG